MSDIEHEPEGELPAEDTTMISMLLSGLEKAGVQPKATEADEQTFHLDFSNPGTEIIPEPRQPSSDE